MMFLIGLLIVFSLIIVLIMNSNKECKKTKIKMDNNEKFIQKNNIPLNAIQLQCIKHNEDSIYRKLYVWIDNNYLKLHMIERHTSTHLKDKTIIPIDNIIYYERYGDYIKEIKVINEKPNIKKAIIGGAIAGGAGAIIGAMDKKIETETKVIDKRNTYLHYYTTDGDKNTFVFDSKGFNTLYKIIPLKAKNIVMQE